MTVSKEITRLEHSSVKLTLTVGKDDVGSHYDDLVKEYAKNIQMPGFRRGKVPREVLVRKFGDALKGEALERTIEGALTQVFDDESFAREDKPLPYSTPKVEEEPKFDTGADLAFSVVYDVLPKVTVGQYKGLEIEVPGAEVAKEDIDRELEAVRERNAIVLDRDDGAAAERDNVVTVNYGEINEEGGIIPGSEREDFVFTLGSGYNIYQFDDEITGMKKGETKDFEKTFPGDFSDPDLAGKTKKIRVTLTALKEKKLPELDDDLAQDTDEKYKTLDDLVNSIRERMQKNLEKRLRDLKISRLLEKITENTPVDVPESMIRIEIDSRWRNLARRLNVSIENIVKIMERDGRNREEIQNEWRPDAVKALHSRLIVETLMEDLALTVSDEELEKEFKDMAEREETTIEEVKKYCEENSSTEFLKEEIKERKLFDILLAENTVKTGKTENYLDLMKING
ncbi:MAG: trigger factor [Treponema sp.]|nr:trigger factor [Treponema sp.]